MKNKNKKLDFYKRRFKNGYTAGYDHINKNDNIISVISSTFGFFDGANDRRAEYKIDKKREKNR